jgi:lipopolysaccharide biosynthesis glycosyltransferase
MALVLTQAYGSHFQEIAAITAPLMDKWARRNGHAFEIETSLDTDISPLFAKFRVKEWLKKYDFVLYLDCDILVRPDAPDPFLIAPAYKFCAFNEGSWCSSLDMLAARAGLCYEAAREWGFDAATMDFSRSYFNSGVFMVMNTPEHLALFDIPDDCPYMWRNTAEQNLLNLRLHRDKVKTYSLPMCFNAMAQWWSTRYLDDNYFIHYAGMAHETRMEVMPRDRDYLVAEYGT